jgi:hypothetical protein
MILNAANVLTLPVVIFTMHREPSLEPVRAHVESGLIAMHVSPSV